MQTLLKIGRNTTNVLCSALNKLESVSAYDILADDLLKPERPEIIPAKAYPEVVLTEFLDFETIVSNVVSGLLCHSCVIVWPLSQFCDDKTFVTIL